MPVKIEKQEGRNRHIYNVLTEADLEERLGFSWFDLMKQAAFNQGYVNVTPSGMGKVVGITKETLTGEEITEVDVELHTAVEQGLDYFIFNPVTKVVYAVTPTADLNVGLGTMLIEATRVTAPTDSPIIEQSAQSAADDRRFRERIIELNTNLTDLNDNVLPELDSKLDTLDGYLQDPSTIPDNYTFFEGIVTNEIWADTGVFFDVWADNVFANNAMIDRITSNHIDVDDLAANDGFIVNLMSQELVLASGTGTSPYVGGLIRSNFDGIINASNVIQTVGTTGFAIDWTGQGVFNDVTVRGTIIVDGSASNVYTKSESNVTIRKDAPAPEFRNDGTALQEGDMWVDTANNNEPYVYDGTNFVRNYTIIDGGYIQTGTVDANYLDVDGIFATNITMGTGGVIKSDNYNGVINSGIIDTSEANYGSSGWAVDYNGNAVFHNLNIRNGKINGGTATEFKFRVESETPAGPATFNSYSLVDKGVVAMTPTGGNVTINGIVATGDGHYTGITNRSGSNAIIIGHESGSATSSNRIVSPTGSNITLGTGDSIILVYDDSTSRWRVLSLTISEEADVTWGAILSKPFSTLSATYFDVVSNELRIDSGKVSNWDAGYNAYPTGVSGNGNGTLTITRNVSSNLTTNLSHTHSASDISSGTLPVSRGGTGQTSFGTNRLLFGNGTGGIETDADVTRSGNNLHADDFVLN